MNTFSLCKRTLLTGLLVAGSCFAGAVANPGPTFVFSGSISPITEDIQLHELIYVATDGTHYAYGAGALNGTCLANQICPFAITLGSSGNTPFTPTEVEYSILGFYGTDPTYGPQSPGDFDCHLGPCLVASNPDVFAVTNLSFSGAFGQFIDPFNTTSFAPFASFEDAIATTFYNGHTEISDAVPHGAYGNFVLATPGNLSGGQILDFSNGTFNGNVSITANEQGAAPEPAGTGLAAAVFMTLLLGLRRARAKGCFAGWLGRGPGYRPAFRRA